MNEAGRTAAPRLGRRPGGWKVAVVGFVVTWLLVAGASLANVDVRACAESIGLAALAGWAVLGLLLALWTGASRGAVALTAAQVVLVPLLAVWATHERAATAVPTAREAGPPTQRPLRVWIDSDPACGTGATTDVDDCWALALALRSPELRPVGIGTVFGNAPRDGPLDADARADLVRRVVALAGADVPVHAGAEQALDASYPATAASEAMAEALADGTLTLVALGPATNVATLLARHPALADRIERIVLVAGRRPGRLLHPGRHWWFHFRDFNVAQDVAAMRVVLGSGVPVTLVPFDAGVGATVTGADLDRLRAGDELARWLARRSEAWLAFWRGPLIQREGFHPFDTLAIAYAAQPERFACPVVRARIGFSLFLAPFGLGRDLEAGPNLAGVPARLCERVAPSLVAWMVDRMRGEGEAG